MTDNSEKYGKQNIIAGITVLPVILTVILESFLYGGQYTAHQKLIWSVLNVVSAVGFPLFLVSLGYSFSLVKERVRYILNLIYIYIVLSFLYLAAYRAAPSYFTHYISSGIGDIFTKGTASLWITYISIFFCVIFLFYLKFSKRLNIVVNILIFAGLICLGIISDIWIPETKFTLFGSYKAAHYCVFFYCGVFFGAHEENISGLFKKITAKILTAVIFLAGAVLAAFCWKLYGYQCLYRIPVYGFCIAVLCALPLWILIHHISGGPAALLEAIGKSALYVYAAAELFAVAIRVLEVKKGHTLPFIDIILAFILSVGIPVLLVWILEKLKIRRAILEPFSYAKTVWGTVKVLLAVLCVLILLASVVILASSMWLVKTWGEVTFDELLFHIMSPLEGANSEVVRDYVIRYGIPEAVICIASIVATCFLYKKLSGRKRKWVAIAELVAALALLCATIGVLDSKLGVIGYLKAQTVDEDFIYDNYTAPDDVNITFPEKKRNLIYIYLESVEVTYADKESGGAFDENCIPELTALSAEGDCFSGSKDLLNGGIPMSGAGYTVGAMFAHSSGLPLKVSISGNDMDTQTSFFPNIKCIGDILSEAGYTNELMIGSDAVFGGRKVLYSNHGNYDMFDYNYALKNGLIPEDYYVWWGFEDEKLFAFAKDELVRLADEDEPFNLTMLTVDSHFEDGYVCPLCEDEFDDQYANVMACSSRQLYDFVTWIRQQDFYEDTLIVLSGDHNTMDVDFCEDVPSDYQRKVYTVFLNSSKEPANDEYRYYSTMDLFPTTLSAMGVEFDGDKLGLGVDLYSGHETLVEQYGVNTLNDYLKQRSAFMSSEGATGYTDEWVKKQNRENSLEITCTEHDVFAGKYIFSVTLRDASRLDNRDNYKGLYIDIYNDQKLICTEEFEYTGYFSNNNVYDCRVELDEYSLLSGGGTDVRIRLEGQESLIIYEISSPDKALVFANAETYTAALDRDDYIVFIAVKDDAYSKMSEEVKNNLYALGTGTDLDDLFRKGFCMITHIPPSGDVIEAVSAEVTDEVSVKGKIESEGITYQLVSGGYESTNKAVIKLNDINYSFNKRGLNIVVYDIKLGRVISSVSIDTNKTLVVRLKNPDVAE